MSNKLLYGEAGSSNYRGGLAYGGLMLPDATGLPNSIAYGISSGSEQVDSLNNPVDLGKHLLVCAAYGIVSYNSSLRRGVRSVSSSQIKTNLAVPLISRLLSLPPNEEPIGPVNGILPGVSTTRSRIARSLLNDLAIGRVCMIDQTGALSLLRTAALPSSDYSRVSTIRASNEVLSSIRDRCMPYIGRSFTDIQIASLSTELDGMMKDFRNREIIQGGSIKITASRLDKINGRMTIKVRFVPPLSIETITVDLSIEPPSATI